MGQTLRGDDAVGPTVAGELERSLMESESVLILDTGPMPENFTGTIRDFGPALVLLVDAADMGEIGGKIHLLDYRDCTGLSASTHTLPPSVIADYMIQEMGCEVALLGVQSLQTDIGAPLSDPVRSAVNQAVAGIVETFSVHGFAGPRAEPSRSETDEGLAGWPNTIMGAAPLEEV
jgi:hydrogenase 3 maturation protease